MGWPRWSVAAAALMAYCLQGLAVIHVLTKSVFGRTGILFAVYFTFLVFRLAVPALRDRPRVCRTARSRQRAGASSPRATTLTANLT